MQASSRIRLGLEAVSLYPHGFFQACLGGLVIGQGRDIGDFGGADGHEGVGDLDGVSHAGGIPSVGELEVVFRLSDVSWAVTIRSSASIMLEQACSTSRRTCCLNSSSLDFTTSRFAFASEIWFLTKSR